MCVGGDWQLAGCDGIFISRCALLDCVYRGQVVAEIHRLSGCFETGIEAIAAEREGTILGLRNKASAATGRDWAVLIGIPENTE